MSNNFWVELRLESHTLYYHRLRLNNCSCQTSSYCQNKLWSTINYFSTRIILNRCSMMFSWFISSYCIKDQFKCCLGLIWQLIYFRGFTRRLSYCLKLILPVLNIFHTHTKTHNHAVSERSMGQPFFVSILNKNRPPAVSSALGWFQPLVLYQSVGPSL